MCVCSGGEGPRNGKLMDKESLMEGCSGELRLELGLSLLPRPHTLWLERCTPQTRVLKQFLLPAITRCPGAPRKGIPACVSSLINAQIGYHIARECVLELGHQMEILGCSFPLNTCTWAGPVAPVDFVLSPLP